MANGPAFSEGWITNDAKRGTGRTTNIILLTVRLALDNPGTWVDCIDHAMGGESTVRDGARGVLNVLSVAHETVGDKIRVIPRPPKESISLPISVLKGDGNAR